MMHPKVKTDPPGKIKIKAALSDLMMEKAFSSITTAEIAGCAGVTEPLIYKYFKDKKDLLHQVLNDHLDRFNHEIEQEIVRVEGATARLRVFVEKSLESYSENRVFSKMLFLEVRSSPVFFRTGAYQNIRRYTGMLLDIIARGRVTGEIRDTVDPKVLRKVILGAIEHACLGEIIFNRELDIKAVSRQMTTIILEGIRP